MSEGATKSEGNHLVYYGTTSVLLALVSSGGQIPDAEAPDLARMLEVDPHARLRAIRVACREAQVRSGGVIGRVRAELAVRTDPDGIRVDIEVEAPVHRESTSARPATPPKR